MAQAVAKGGMNKMKIYDLGTYPLLGSYRLYELC